MINGADDMIPEDAQASALASQCVGVCKLNERQIYVGCGRYVIEITAAAIETARARSAGSGKLDRPFPISYRRIFTHPIHLEPGLQMDAVRPDINVTSGREIALAPAYVLLGPDFLQPDDGRCDRPGASLPGNAASASSKSPVDMPFR